MTQTRLITQVAPAVANLTVVGLAGLPGSALNLQSPDGLWKLSIPRSAVEGVTPEPGEVVVVALTFVRTAVEEIPEGLILGRAN